MNCLKMLKPQGDQCQTLDETGSIELPTTPNAWDMKVFPCSKLNVRISATIYVEYNLYILGTVKTCGSPNIISKILESPIVLTGLVQSDILDDHL